MPKQLIVNADDFGRHTLINRAVEQGVARGLIRSATVMVTGAAFAEAVELAHRTPALGMGIHFTLVNARPVLQRKSPVWWIRPPGNCIWTTVLS